MQFRTAALSLFAAVAAAQTNDTTTSLSGLVSQIPTCALSCFNSAASSANCGPTDFDCLCGPNKTAFINAIGPCILISNSCTTDEQTKAGTLATEICADVATEPDPTDVASASNLVTSALASVTATQTPDAGARPTVGMGLLGAAAIAALAL